MGRAKQLLDQWLTHRTVLEKLLETVPDEHLGFKPWPGAMALGEMAQHVARSADMFVNMAKTGQGRISMPETVPFASTAELLDFVRRMTEKTKAVYETITDEELRIHFDHPHPNFNGPREKILVVSNDHEIHHKGQLFVYARMIGVEKLPFFI
jgi:uncharacterized damage-inducible protein DinB